MNRLEFGVDTSNGFQEVQNEGINQTHLSHFLGLLQRGKHVLILIIILPPMTLIHFGLDGYHNFRPDTSMVPLNLESAYSKTLNRGGSRI